MGIRIQPQEVKICKKEPFKHDLLDRKEKAKVLTSLVSNIDGPCTMAIDAAWGAGKTTFLKMWAQHLRNGGFPVVEFNAWETDASGDPFLSLTSEITQGLRKWPDRRVKAKLQRVENEGKKWLARLAPGAIRLAASPLPIVGSEVGHSLSTHAGEMLSRYVVERESASQFKSSLRDLANTIWISTDGKPIVVLIDELDRCRPTYAIELLETAKHIFGVDHVVFVLAVNRQQLAHSVKALYGSKFDAEGYLRRFFDIDYGLPAPDRESFIRDMLASIGVDGFLEGSRDQFAKEHMPLVFDTFALFWSKSNLSLRSIGQAIHRYGLVLASTANNDHLHSRTLAVLAVLRSVDPSSYSKFLEGETTTEETIESFFSQPNIGQLRDTVSGALVEAVIIAARILRAELRYTADDLRGVDPVLSGYKQVLEVNNSGGTVVQRQLVRARMIYDMVLGFHNLHPSQNEPLGYKETVDRLELFSQELQITGQ